MNQNQKELFDLRIEAAIMAFAKAHKINLTGKVIRWDPWETEKVFDLTLRLEVDKKPE